MAELADAQDLKSCSHCESEGSIPSWSTKKTNMQKLILLTTGKRLETGLIEYINSDTFLEDVKNKFQELYSVPANFENICECKVFNKHLVPVHSAISLASIPKESLVADFVFHQKSKIRETGTPICLKLLINSHDGTFFWKGPHEK
jgi:hypothetical protein